MPLTTVSSGDTITAATYNANFALCVLTDTAKTISVTHTWSASQTFTGGWTAGAACSISTGGFTVTAGGLTVSAGGLTVTGNSTVTGSLTATTTVVARTGFTTDQNTLIVIGGATDVQFKNSANNATNVTIADAGGVTVHRAGLTVTTGGLTVTAGGLTVSAGTTAVQALTCTTLTATAQLKTTVTTQQLALHYDADNHLAVTVSSAGAVTYNATGASAGHSFSDTVTLASSAIVAGSGQALAFFGGVTALKQEVTGSAGGNAALQSLLSALETYGLITDSSS